VRPHPARRSNRVRLRAAAFVSAGALAVVGLPATVASAETASQAKAQAHQAALQVKALQPRLQAALAAYEKAVRELGTSVNAGVGADQAAEAAQQAVQAAEQAQVQRVRALYMSGGETGLLATVLDSQGPADLLERVSALQRVLQMDSDSLAEAQQAAELARVQANAQLSTADTATTTVEQVQADYQQLLSVVAAAQGRLSALNAKARGLAEAEAAQRALAAALAQAAAAGNAAASSARGSAIPPDYLVLYKAAAATCPGFDWHVLAAIGQVESHHGRSVGPSSAGAEGPMQFLPATFAAYAVDGNGDGVEDIWNPADSIYTAAHYMCANGAGGTPKMLYTAIWHYNHADWYVQMVLRIAADLRVTYP
jgi:soluble lytic murein transglycosylase-like protein